MHFLFLSLIGVRLAFAGLSDTLVNVVVSASRQAVHRDRVAIPMYQAPFAGDQLQNTPEFFKAVPGVFLQRTNQGGGSAFVRGLTGNQTLLILDGIRFNNSTFRYGPNQYLNTIDPFSLDRVEVIRGSGAVQYGSDALTGAVHLLTSKPQFNPIARWSGQMLARGISQGMELSLVEKINFQSANASFSFAAAAKKMGDLTRGGDGAFQRPTGYQENNLLFQYRQKLGNRVILEHLVQQNKQQHVPVFHKVQMENYALNEMSLQAYRRAFSRLIYAGMHPWLQQIELTASVQQSLEKRALQKNASLTRRNEADQVNTLAFIGQVKSQWTPAWSSMQGIETYRDGIRSVRSDEIGAKSTSLRGLYPNNATYATASAFSLHEWAVRNWQVHAGIRFQYTSASLPDTTVGLAKISMGSWVYDAGASYACGKQVTLFTSLATGFRAPNLDDLGSLGIVDFRYEYPAYALKPEKSFTKNVGIRAHSAKWNAEFVAFHTNIQDMITRVKTSSVVQGYPVYRKENNVEAYLYGLEWVQQIRLAEHWSLANQLSYTLGQNVTLNEPMRRIPPLFGNLSISYQGPKISTMIRWQGAARQTRLSAGDKSDNRMDPSGTAGWGIVNVHSTLQISPHIRVGMQGENLGNVRYRMHGSGIDGMGRSLHVQLNYLW